MVKKGIWLLILMVFTGGCLDEPDCYQLNNHLLGIAFKKLGNSTADTVAINAFGTFDPNVLFLNRDTTISRLLGVPLNYFEDETTFFFQEPDTLRILRLGYLSQAQFVSEDCGEKFVLSALRVLEHNFDSVRLVSDFPTSNGTSIQIEIFHAE